MPQPIQVHVVAAVVLEQEGKYLLIQENRPGDDQVHRKWCFPAGHVDEGETIEEAAVREAREESGYEVRLVRKLGIFQVRATDAVKHIFYAEIIGGELAWLSDEILDARWWSWEELQAQSDQLRDECILEVIGLVEGD